VARNIEIKARVDNVEALRSKVAPLADRGPVELFQDDWFFRCAAGRLKLRVFSADQGELIFYRRPDQPGPKESQYWIAPTAAPDALRETLARAYGVAGRVRKHRTLFVIGRTRIHLDRVEGLGEWLELEVVLGENEPTSSGVAEAQRLMATLAIEPAQLVEGAYVDLTASSEAGQTPATGHSARSDL